MKRKNNSTATEKSVQTQSSETVLEQVQTAISNDTTSNNGENTMTVNFESLAKAEQLKSVADYQRYQNLLRDLAAGKPHDDTEVIEICNRVDRNVAMLEEDVKWRQKRDAMIAEVHKKSQYEAEKAAVDSEMVRLRAEFKPIEEEYNRKHRAESFKYDRARENLSKISQLCSTLRDDCRDPNLHAELEKLQAKQQELGFARYWQDKAENTRRKIVYKNQEIEQQPTFGNGVRDKIIRLKAEIKDLEREAKQIQAEIDDTNAKYAETEKAENEVRERMIYA